MKRSDRKIRIENLNTPPEMVFDSQTSKAQSVDRAVRGALGRLSFGEREAVERFHFLGESCRQIGMFLRLSEFESYTQLQRGRHKLKILLAPFVERRYGAAAGRPRCPVCRSKQRSEIEALLQTKTREESWKRILGTLKTNFQIISSGSALSAHLKIHRQTGRRPGRGTF